MGREAQGFRSGPATRRRRLERALAAGAVVFAVGGLVLVRASDAATPPLVSPFGGVTAPRVTLDGPDASFQVNLGQGAFRAAGGRAVVEVRATAKKTREVAAPASLAIVLDRSGSMSGEKIREARRAVDELVGRLGDDDEVALVAYADTAEVLVPLERVGRARARLRAAVAALDADGGTTIVGGLSAGLHALDEAWLGRVRRVVLVTDGIDDSRARTVELARTSAAGGVVVSALGVGLDFDEAYLGEVSRTGHGNFAFVRTGGDLSRFLAEEARQTAGTTVEDARVRLVLPPGARLGRVVGAVAERGADGAVELRFGALFAGDAQRAVLELDLDASVGERVALGPSASYVRVADRGRVGLVSPAPLVLAAVATDDEVARTRDGAVLASVASALASDRQLEAAEAFARGDVARARALAETNARDLAQARGAAPPAASAALGAQLAAMGEDQRAFERHVATSDEGKAAAKQSVLRSSSNLKREVFK